MRKKKISRNSRNSAKNRNAGKVLSEVPAWIFIGAVFILSPIFAFTTIDNINRQKKNTEILLSEKGAALIRSFEAGTRTGLMGGPGETRQLQKLLYETAQQPDIEYLLVANTSGTIIAHSNFAYTGVMLNLLSHNKKIDLRQITGTNALYKQIVVSPEGKRTFVVFRKFSPTGEPHTRSIISMFNNNIVQKSIDDITSPEKVIVVALDMSSVDEMREIHIRDAIITGVVLLLAGISGIIALFMIQGYRSTRSSLSKIKVFSDTLVENMPVGLIALDRKYRIVSSNHVAKSILSINSTDKSYEKAENILPKEMCDQIMLLGEKIDLIETDIECAINGLPNLPLEISAAVLKNHENRPSGYICIFKDLTEERALKSEVQRSQRLASVGKLAAGVAHEVRNPLSSIKGFATYFKERYGDIPEDQQISDIMIQEVDRLNRVVGELLEFARPVFISRKQVEMMPFIENSIKLIELKAKESNIHIVSEIPHDTSGPDNHSNPDIIDTCGLDPDRINQVLLNLYLNAIDAMDQEGTLSVKVFRPENKHCLSIQIADTGCGIKKEDLDQIFDPYFTTKSSGTGLGLAISHNIIEAHNGEINIESTPGEGTMITITLPCNEKENHDR